jgi:ligand-binding sensor domain-containing protein
MPIGRRARLLLAASASALLAVAGAVWLIADRISGSVRTEMAADGRDRRPLSFVPVPPQVQGAEWLGGGDVAAVAAAADSLWTAGSFGVIGDGGLYDGLPSLRVSAMLLWRGRPLAALEAGGLFLYSRGQWEEAKTGFGALHVRHLLEGAGGELYICAKEGLFRVQWGGNAIERLHGSPARTVALGAGLVLVGGEQGLFSIQGGRASPVTVPDTWVERVGLMGDGRVALLTAQGLAMGPMDGEVRPIRQDARSVAQLGDTIYVVGESSILKMGTDGRFSQEYLTQSPRRVFASNGLLFADTDAGLFKKGPSGWAMARRRPSSLPPGSTHVTALARFQGRLAVGTFDGGVAIGAFDGNGASGWRRLPIADAWGINALSPFGGTLAVASLRGASRLEGDRMRPLKPAGAAFSLAMMPTGMAVGFGHGVLLPGGEFLSAFHGLPGNQALAMLYDDYLYVGTPSGLGAIAGSKVAWRTVDGDGLLPHPWVTALVGFNGALYVGTYGGGVARRTKGGRSAKGTFEQFQETDGLKINVGCMAVLGGALIVGTDGKGLFRLDMESTRFEPMSVPIPSRSVTALLQDGDALLVGTSEGIARLPRPLLAQAKTK